MRVSAVQQVNVAMFSTGSFKNWIGDETEILNSGATSFRGMIPIKMNIKKDFSWIAMDDTGNYKRREVLEDFDKLAPSVVKVCRQSLFIICVQYYVAIEFHFSRHKTLLAKVPFILKREVVGGEEDKGQKK